MNDHQSQKAVKMLLLGPSGAGKSGLLATLAQDHTLFIADFDNGLDILSDPKVLDPSLRGKIFFKSFYDKTKIVAGKPFLEVGGLDAFTNSMGDWREDGKSMGGIYSWGSDICFVVDSLTFLGQMCMNYALSLTSHLGQKPSQPEWGTAIDLQEDVIERLYNPAVQCNVVVTAHLQTGADDLGSGTTQLYPSALGKKFPPKIGRYFNNVVQVRKVGSGEKVTREILTQGDHMIALKTSKPSLIQAVAPPDLGAMFKILKS